MTYSVASPSEANYGQDHTNPNPEEFMRDLKPSKRPVHLSTYMKDRVAAMEKYAKDIH